MKSKARSISLSEANVYTMRQLNQDTARVIEQINDSGVPAAITKHGRFVALIQPLAGAAIESMVLTGGALADSLHERATDADSRRLSSEELLSELEEDG